MDLAKENRKTNAKIMIGVDERCYLVLLDKEERERGTLVIQRAEEEGVELSCSSSGPHITCFLSCGPVFPISPLPNPKITSIPIERENQKK